MHIDTLYKMRRKDTFYFLQHTLLISKGSKWQKYKEWGFEQSSEDFKKLTHST